MQLLANSVLFGLRYARLDVGSMYDTTFKTLKKRMCQKYSAISFASAPQTAWAGFAGKISLEIALLATTILMCAYVFGAWNCPSLQRSDVRDVRVPLSFFGGMCVCLFF